MFVAAFVLPNRRWATLVHRDAVARQSAVAWTACAAGVAMMAAGKAEHGRRMLEGARLEGLLGDEGGFDTLK